MDQDLLTRPTLPDADALRERLVEIGKDPDLKDFARQKAVLALLKEALGDGRACAEARLEAGASGVETARTLCDIQDTIIRVLYDYTTSFPYRASTDVKGEKLGLVAVGGYGRGLLAPGSDIDILFLLPWKQTPWGESVVEYMLYILWDLGLKVGHATRTVDECIKQALADMTIRTTLIDARLLWGDEALFEELMTRFESDVVEATDVSQFIDAKLTERNTRHTRAGASRFLVEPNIKDGKGAMRDLHTLYWIGKYVYRVDEPRDLIGKGLFNEEEFELFEERDRFFWDVRCHLHFLAGRAEDRLSFDRQPEMARRMGYEDRAGQSAVERFMSDYFRAAMDVGNLTRIFCAALEWQEKREAPQPGSRLLGGGPVSNFTSGLFGFRRRGRKAEPDTGNPDFIVDHGRMAMAAPDVFAKDPVNILRMFLLALDNQILVHPSTLTELNRSLHLIDDDLRSDPEAAKIFFAILMHERDPERVLRRMHETGVMGTYIPAFGKVEAMMQFNMYHHYTVDEHTIRAVSLLSQIDRGELSEDHPLANDIIHKVISREVLYIAVLLHDIAKGRDGDHSEIGADIAREVCPKLGFDASETELVAWLVLNHLVFSDYAQTRDIADPQTIQTFCDLIQTPERLRLLLILTVADIRAVGPGVWNGWKGELLRQLYYEAERILTGGHSEKSEERVAWRHEDLEKALPEMPGDERQRFFGRLEDHYWLGLDEETQVRHAHLLSHADSAEARGEEPERVVLHAEPDSFRDVSRISIYTKDVPGLFASLSGAITACGGSIADARVYTTTDGMALDVFWVQDTNEEGPFHSDRLERLKKLICDTLDGEASLRPMMPKSLLHRRTSAFSIEPEVHIDNGASEANTVIEASGLDRPGLLYDISDALMRLDLSVASAHIATFGERAVGVYYVQDKHGLKVTHEVTLRNMRAALKSALEDPTGAGALFGNEETARGVRA